MEAKPPGRPDKPIGTAGDKPIGTAGVDETAEPPSLIARVPFGLVFRWAAAATLGVLVVLLSGYTLYAVRDLLVLVMIALFVAVSLDPAVRWLVRRGLKRPVAVTLVIVFMLALFGVFIWSIVPPLVEQGGRLFADLPGYLRKLPEESKSFRELSDRYNLTNRLSALAADLPTRIAGSAIGFVQQFLGALLSTVTVIVLTIYFMADMPRMRRGLVRLFPHRRRPQVAEIVNVVVDKVGAYMIGNLIISLFAGVATFLCLSLLRVPFALPLAVTVAITDLIPLIGATLGAAIGVLVALFTVGPWPGGVVVLAFFIVYQQVENYLIAPRVLRNSVDLPSVAVLLVALIGGSVLGVVGALMSIPIAAAVKVVLTPTIATMHQPPPPVEAKPEA
ncbi:AI-2E family transporter [Planosporangium mesophilum]|uniref:AI-2E family transporter n=1 Tax=Planosporangium mesophilum TaxID=689768 RepID=A0A8J3TGA8_9ACTN|nr:AI-2E family transporter [Planosporangium mesophilum]